MSYGLLGNYQTPLIPGSGQPGLFGQARNWFQQQKAADITQAQQMFGNDWRTQGQDWWQQQKGDLRNQAQDWLQQQRAQGFQSGVQSELSPIQNMLPIRKFGLGGLVEPEFPAADVIQTGVDPYDLGTTGGWGYPNLVENLNMAVPGAIPPAITPPPGVIPTGIGVQQFPDYTGQKLSDRPALQPGSGGLSLGPTSFGSASSGLYGAFEGGSSFAPSVLGELGLGSGGGAAMGGFGTKPLILQRGGMAPGNPARGDSVRAMLTPKEMVLTELQQSAIMIDPKRRHLLKPDQILAIERARKRISMSDYQ